MSTILICDDDVPTARALAKLLGTAGHRAHCAANGGEAMNMLESVAIDLLVLDEMIPYVSGRELLRILRISPKLRHVPVVIWSALNDPAAIAEARQLGAKDYWVKGTMHGAEMCTRINGLL